MKTLPEDLDQVKCSFNAHLNRLVDELSLAKKWRQASLLLAVYQHPLWGALAEAAVEKFLLASGDETAHIALQPGKTLSDLNFQVKRVAARGNKVGLVTGLAYLLPMSAGSADENITWHGLEALLDEFLLSRYRLIFFIDEGILQQFVDGMPEFWNFRHSVASFAGVPLPARLRLYRARHAPERFIAQPAEADDELKAGILAWRKGDYQKAEIILRKALTRARREARVSRQIDCLLALALVYMDQKLYDKALETYDEVEALQPGTTQGLGNRGKIYLHLRRYEEAVNLFRQMINKNAENVMAWLGLGQAHLEAGAYEESVAAYKRACDLSPAFKDAWLGLAQALSQAGWFDEAVAAWMEALRRDAHWPEAWAGLGATLFALDKFSEASKAYQRALALQPRFAWWRSLAQIYERQGDWQAAQEAYQQALTLADKPEDKAALDASLQRMERQAGADIQRLRVPDEGDAVAPAAAGAETSFISPDETSPFALPDSLLDGTPARLHSDLLEISGLSGRVSLGDAIRRRAEMLFGAHRRG